MNNPVVNMRFLWAVFILKILSMPLAANGTDEMSCQEADIKLSDAIKVKKVFASYDKGNDLLTLHFDIPLSVNGAPFQRILLTKEESDGTVLLSTPLLTWQMDDSLEAVMFVNRSHYQEYTLAAHYYGGSDCGTVARLDLKGNQMIADYLSCIEDRDWKACNFSEAVLENAF